MKEVINMKKVLSVTLLLFISMLMLIACNTSTESSSENNESGNFTVHIANMGMAPLNVAKEKGWMEEEFAKLGAKVEWSTHTAGPPVNEGIASKRIDLAVLGEGAVLGGANNNLDTKLISLASTGKKGVNYIIVPKGSDIKNASDLKGKQIGVMSGTSHHVFLLKVLDTVGLKQSDINIVNLSIADAQPAFQSGQLDAWVSSDPLVKVEVDSNGAAIIASGETENIKSPTFYIARGEFAKEHPEVVEAFLKVIDKTNQFQQENYEEYIETAAKSGGTEPRLVELFTVNAEYQNSLISEEILNEFQTSADILTGLGYIKKDVDVNSLVNSTYINNIKQ
jgi:sulfonate transport system substrate-binding protein